MNDRATPSGVVAVIPCYNEGDRLFGVVEGMHEVVGRVIVVDDGSTDGAPARLNADSAELIRLPQNQGKGRAMMAGFKRALETPEVRGVFIIDADGQHDPREAQRLLEAFDKEGADLVIGSRMLNREGVPWPSWLGNKLTALITARLLGQQIPDTQSGFRLHSRRLVERIVCDIPGGRYETEMEILVMAVRCGYRVASVPIKTIYERGNPTSHFNKLRDSYLVWRSLFRSARRWPQRNALSPDA